MADVAKKYQDSLERIKKNVRKSYEYFMPNYNSFNSYRKFVFVSSLTDNDKAVLTKLQKPVIEFNVLEAYISRLRGEFSKQEPSIEISPSHGSPINDDVLAVVQDHFRYMESMARYNGCAYNVYTDQLSGGFSVMKVWTEYANDRSMDQVIKWDRAYDPTLCGFDPLSRLPSKADGRFCFEFFPKTKDEFKEEYPDVSIENIKFVRNEEGFNFSYKTNKEDILLICDYYEKKKKKAKLLRLSSGKVVTQEEYDEFKDAWEKSMRIEQIPMPVGKPRMTEIETICRYRFIEDRVLEYVETDFRFLPLVFVDGNSILYRESAEGAYIQKTRPYIYQAMGTQKLKNFAGQTLANELENMVQHKFKVPLEGIPEKYIDAYTNTQVPNTLIYRAYKEDDPDKPVPPPQEISRVPAPPEVMGTFASSDQTIQSILGSYDAALGINNNQLSGVAIVEAATQSNAASMPYIVSYLQALNQVSQIVIDLIPKYYKTPRTIPVMSSDGRRRSVVINNPGSPSLNYNQNDLEVKVEAGVNFTIQKSRNLQQLIAMTQAMPIFAQFMNQYGLGILIDNLDIYGADQLKPMADKFMEQIMIQQQQAQQNAQNQVNPAVMKAQNDRMKLMQSAQQQQMDNQFRAAELSMQNDENNTDRMRLLSDIQDSKRDAIIELDKHQTEKTRAAVDLAIKLSDSHQKLIDGHMKHELSETKTEEMLENVQNNQ